ncbi:MAG TPA: bifunctional hydroxymethylpyrimidine kinase/phosphomethylpyrimidine kinase [Kiritimatiellia bacterium]|nr:bifunctional hydroxymethylpyrimidine kinase/phosphomethylpyrimidine kinase [Kiritimatiellia bacterium]
MTAPSRALTIAGSDSGGGAGIQADLKTFEELGVYGMSVVTALTAQNTLGVTGVHQVPAEFVTAQLNAVLGDLGADAVKVGMLGSASVAEAVAAGLVRHGVKKMVLDPVMVSTSGTALLDEAGVKVLIRDLIPQAMVVTPNLLEAEHLLGRRIAGVAGMETAARDLLGLGCGGALVKGGHAEGPECVDVLAWRKGSEVGVRRYTGRRRATDNTHGTGCTLSAAMAAFLARGWELAEAVGRAKACLEAALEGGASWRLGGGPGPVSHFHLTKGDKP